MQPAFHFGRLLRLSLLSELAVLAVTFAILLFMVYPTAWVLLASLKTPETMFASGSFDFTLDNYRSLFTGGFGQGILNSMVLCLVAVAVSTVISANAAYVFSRMRFRAKRFIFGSVLMGQTFPWIILVTPLFILFARMGLLNNRLSMIFVYVAISIPFSVYLLVGYLQSVPRSLDEAAIIDGCSPFQVLWKIIFPIMLPGIVATATYAFLLCWSEYLFALAFLTRPELKTMPLLLYGYFGENVTEWGNVIVAWGLSKLPKLLLFLLLQTRLA